LKTDKKSAEEQDSDYTVGITLGKDEKGNHYLLSMFRDRGLTPSQIYQAIIDEYNKFKKLCHVISIEKNNFGQLHTFTLQKNTDLPIKEHVTTAGNKNSAWIGVPSLTTLFENGKMILPSKTPEDLDKSDLLCTELYGLGKEKHDDTVMSLWIAVSAMREADFQYSIAIGDEAFDAHGEKIESTKSDLDYHKRAEANSMQSLWDSLHVDFDIDDEGF
jgi:phage terminase large subunit-like protein